mgnify:CR=1 FL=1
MNKMHTLDSSFKKIPGFSDDYRIYPDGTVISFKHNKIRRLKPVIRPNGYVSITLMQNGRPKHNKGKFTL